MSYSLEPLTLELMARPFRQREEMSGNLDSKVRGTPQGLKPSSVGLCTARLKSCSDTKHEFFPQSVLTWEPNLPNQLVRLHP
jgi:hypothetical protein